MPNYTQANRLMSVNTPLGPDALVLTDFSGQEAISQLFAFNLVLLAENGAKVDFGKLLGQRASVRVGPIGGRPRFFHGIVSRFTQSGRDDTFTRYRALLVPELWLW